MRPSSFSSCSVSSASSGAVVGPVAHPVEHPGGQGGVDQRVAGGDLAHGADQVGAA